MPEIKDFQYFYYEALDQVDENMYEEAIKSLQDARSCDVENPLSYFELGKVLATIGRYDDAAVEFTTALTHGYNKPHVYEQLINLYTCNKEYRKALYYLPNCPSYQADDPQKLSANIGLCYFYLKDYAAARKFLGQSGHRCVEYLYKLQFNDYRNETEILEASDFILTLHGTMDWAIRQKSRILITRGELNKALDLLILASQVHPGGLAYIEEIGNCYFKLENYHRAVCCYLWAQQKGGNKTDSLDDKIGNARKKGGMLQVKSIAILLDEAALALILIRNEDAVKLYSEVLKLDPDNHTAQLNLGETYLKLFKSPQALDCFYRLLELKSTVNLDRIYMGIADAKNQVNSGLENILDWKKALEYNSNNPVIYYSMALVYYKNDSFKNALEAVTQCLKLNAEHYGGKILLQQLRKKTF